MDKIEGRCHVCLNKMTYGSMMCVFCNELDGASFTEDQIINIANCCHILADRISQDRGKNASPAGELNEGKGLDVFECANCLRLMSLRFDPSFCAHCGTNHLSPIEAPNLDERS